jgi:hypothetical protein
VYASYVVRVSLESLESGELVGIVEVVDTGERVGFTGTDDLLAILRSGSDEPDVTSPQRVPPTQVAGGQ